MTIEISNRPVSVKSFHDLDVWRISMDMVDKIYGATSAFPKDEMYGLTNQIRRTAVSVPSNIAEGSAHNGTKEFVQFLFIARGSLAELQTQLEIARRRNYFGQTAYDELILLVHRVGQMTAKLIQALQK